VSALKTEILGRQYPELKIYFGSWCASMLIMFD
jgi:hypothetical protein